MKNRRRSAWLCLLLAPLLVWLLADSAAIRISVREGLALCGRSVIPALFPFLVVSSLLISLGIGELLSRPAEWVMQPLFRIDGAGACALMLGLIGGYPLGPRTTAELYQAGLLSRPEAERLLSFCNVANPAFFVSVLGQGVFGSSRIGLWLWLIHLLSALLTGLLFRGCGRETATAPRTPRRSMGAVSFSGAFVSAVSSGLQSTLGICAFILFFYVPAQPLSCIAGPAGTALTGILELFSATERLTPDASGFLLAATLSGWGGLSVLCQTLAALGDSGLSRRNCLLGKLTQAAFSALAAWLLLPHLF